MEKAGDLLLERAPTSRPAAAAAADDDLSVVTEPTRSQQQFFFTSSVILFFFLLLSSVVELVAYVIVIPFAVCTCIFPLFLSPFKLLHIWDWIPFFPFGTEGEDGQEVEGSVNIHSKEA